MRLRFLIIYTFAFPQYVQANENQLDVFKMSSQYLSGNINEKQLTEFLKSKQGLGFTDEERFLILDALNKKPLSNNDTAAFVHLNSSTHVHENTDFEKILSLQENPKPQLKKETSWLKKVALPLVLGFLVFQSARKKVVIDSTPFN
jgi:hypothetical protein